MNGPRDEPRNGRFRQGPESPGGEGRSPLRLPQARHVDEIGRVSEEGPTQRGWNMRLGIKALVIGSLLALPHGAGAQLRNYHTLGPGNSSCGKWTDQVRTEAGRAFLMSYVLGCLMGYNRYGSQPNGHVTRGVDIDGVEQAIGLYCRDHPLVSIEDASANVIQQLEARK